MFSIFSCAYWPSVCLLYRDVGLGLLPIFFLLLPIYDWVVCFSDTEPESDNVLNVFQQSVALHAC